MIMVDSFPINKLNRATKKHHWILKQIKREGCRDLEIPLSRGMLKLSGKLIINNFRKSSLSPRNWQPLGLALSRRGRHSLRISFLVGTRWSSSKGGLTVVIRRGGTLIRPLSVIMPFSASLTMRQKKPSLERCLNTVKII